MAGMSAKEQFGWLYPKNSILRKIADKIMLELAQQGIERQIYHKYYRQLSNLQCDTSSSYNPIGLDILWMVFKIFASGFGIAVIIMTLEIATKFWKKHKVAKYEYKD